MAVRINAIPAGGFRHGGLVAGKAWTPLAELDAKQRAALRDHHGRFLRVHPDDVSKLGEFGLAFAGAKNPLVDTTTKHDAPKGDGKPVPPPPGSDAKKSTTKNDAPKGDGKKE